MSGLTGSPLLRPAELLASLTETFTSGLSTVRSPSPLPDITTVATGRFHRRVFHPLDLQLASLHRPGGFTLAQLAEAVQQRAGRSAKAYSSRNAAYDLAKLKGKKLVHRVKESRCYKADPSGVRAMCAYLILREKVIKPLLAGVVRPFGRPPKNQSPVDQHYVRLREELNRTFETPERTPVSHRRT